MTAKGQGCDADIETAKKFLSESALLGNPYAAEKIEQLETAAPTATAAPTIESSESIDTSSALSLFNHALRIFGNSDSGRRKSTPQLKTDIKEKLKKGEKISNDTPNISY